MVSTKLFSAVVAIAVILSIVGASSIAFAQTQTSIATANATKTATANATTTTASANATKTATANATTTTASATASGGFLGLPGFEAVYGVVGLLAVAYLVMRRRQ